jgi:hypothetical protein
MAIEGLSKKRKNQKANTPDKRVRPNRPTQIWIDVDGAVVEKKGAKNAIPYKMENF